MGIRQGEEAVRLRGPEICIVEIKCSAVLKADTLKKGGCRHFLVRKYSIS